MKGVKYKTVYCCELFKSKIESGKFVLRGGERKFNFIVEENNDKAVNHGIQKITYHTMNYCMFCGRNLDYVSIDNNVT